MKEYRVVAEVWPLGKTTTEEVSMPVTGEDKSDVREQVREHFGTALKAIPSVEEMFNQRRGGGGGSLALA